MGLFDVFKPTPEEKKPKAPPPHALPHHGERGEKVHALPGPSVPGPAPAATPSKGGAFSIYAPKEVAKSAEAEKARKEVERPRSLIDALVPKEEQGSMYRQSSSPLFERTEPTFRQEPVRQAAEPARPASAHRPSRVWTLPTPEELADRMNHIFDFEAIFRKLRNREFPGTLIEDWIVTPIVPIAPVDDFDVLGQVFGIPRHIIDAYLQGVSPEQQVEAMGALWDDIFWPILDMTTGALLLAKPEDMPGFFVFGQGLHDPSIIELQYFEHR